MSKQRPRMVGRTLEALWHQLPKVPQEHAFEAVADAFDLSDGLIETIGDGGGESPKRIYLAALITAVASCASVWSDGGVQVMSREAIHELDRLARSSTGAVFLQGFAREAGILKEQLNDNPISNYPDDFFAYALDNVQPEALNADAAISAVECTEDRWVDISRTVGMSLLPMDNQ